MKDYASHRFLLRLTLQDVRPIIAWSHSHQCDSSWATKEPLARAELRFLYSYAIKINHHFYFNPGLRRWKNTILLVTVGSARKPNLILSQFPLFILRVSYHVGLITAGRLIIPDDSRVIGWYVINLELDRPPHLQQSIGCYLQSQGSRVALSPKLLSSKDGALNTSEVR